MGLPGVTGRQWLLCTHDPGKGCVSCSTIPLPAVVFLWADHVILQVLEALSNWLNVDSLFLNICATATSQDYLQVCMD
jgi:hypothetical protein